MLETVKPFIVKLVYKINLVIRNKSLLILIKVKEYILNYDLLS